MDERRPYQPPAFDSDAPLDDVELALVEAIATVSATRIIEDLEAAARRDSPDCARQEGRRS
jgi:hypothetical protein